VGPQLGTATPGRWPRSEGFELGLVRSYCQSDTKALAELDSDGLMKLLFRKDSGESARCPHLPGSNAADLIQENANAVARRQGVRELARRSSENPSHRSVNWWRWPTQAAAQLLRTRATPSIPYDQYPCHRPLEIPAVLPIPVGRWPYLQ